MNNQTIKTLESKMAQEGVAQHFSLKTRIFRFIKDAMFFVYLYCGYVQVRDFVLACLGRSRAVVLYYHRINTPDVLTRSPEQFRDDLDYFNKHYECLSLRELCDRLR